MNIYYLFSTYDTKLFKKLLLLSRGMRKHLLFYVFEEVKETILERFKQKYSLFFDYESFFLSLQPISFCKESGMRLDAVLKFKLNEKTSRKFEGK